jgi:hypothetical protein
MVGVSIYSVTWSEVLISSTERLPESGEAKYVRRSGRLLPVGRRCVSFILL